jgi:hypothetical protein
MPTGDPRKPQLLEPAQRHARIRFSYAFSGHCEDEQGLATFAICALTQ